MKFKLDKTPDLSLSAAAGLGPAAWDRDTQKGSMHPPIPGHIEHVEHDMKLHEREHAHHVVQRRHPESENDMGTVREKNVGECCFSEKAKAKCPRCRSDAR